MKRPLTSDSLPRLSRSPSVPRYGAAEIAPLRRLPRTVHTFDYSLTSELAIAPGDLVAIPFHGQATRGVVVRVKQQAPVGLALKPIERIIAPRFINTQQLALAQRLAEHYGVSLGAGLMLCSPLLPNKNFSPGPVTKAHATRATTNRTQVTVLQVEAAEERATVVGSLIQRVVRRQQQIFLLVPEAYYLTYWHTHLAAYKPVIFSTEQPIVEQRRIWQDIRSGAAKLIVGTRAALFLPFFNLGGVIVDYAENENYKQADQNPRYDSLEVARWLAALWQSSVAYLSPAPPIELWQQAQQGPATWRKLNAARTLTRVDIIDLKTQQKTKRQELISAPLRETISRTFERNGKVFLYHNRRGTATAVLCHDCGFTPACPTCERPLVWEARMNQLTCYRCGTMQAMPLPCPSCGGANLRYRGAGLGQLEREVLSLWPRTSTVTVEGESSPGVSAKVAQAQLILGSRAVLKYLDFSTIDLIAMVAPDTELALPEFRAAEEAWARARLFLTSGAKRLAVQTYRPQHHVFQSLGRGDTERFYRAELAARAPYRYPPHGSLLRFTTQSSTKQTALTEARAIRATIAKAIPQTCELVGPYPDYYVQVRGRYRFHLLLRYPNHDFDPTVLWGLLPDGILIDRHPWNILS